MNRLLKISLLLYFSFILSCSGEGGESTPAYQYHTPEEVLTFLDEVVLNYPSIAALESVGAGLSEDGRPIRAIVISDNPTVQEGEPSIRLTGGIHGSEKITVELMIRFIEYLVSNYNKPGSEEITDLINSRYIVIIPVMNPDGLAAGNRFNSRAVDLNRNFSYAWEAGVSHGDYPFSEAESQAIRDFSTSNIFHLSVTYHSGAVVLNLPFDYGAEHATTPVVPDENTLVRSFGLAYSESGLFLDNPDVMSSVYSYNGIINGGDWYIAYGSLQDWSYKVTGCLDLTIEVARRNPSSEEGVQQIFMYNRDSLIEYIKKAGYGIHGRVTSSTEPDGVKDAEVTVIYNNGSGITGDIKTKTDSKGYYNRILSQGSYQLVFSKSGYTSYPVSSVNIPDDASRVQQDIVLTP